MPVEDLRHQTTVSQRGRVAVTEARSRLLGQLPFKGLQSAAHPVAVPGVPGIFVQLQRAREVLEHAQVVDGVDLPGNRLRQRPHSGPRQRFARHQGGFGMDVVQVLDDRHRLRQARAIVQFQQWHQLVGRDIAVGGLFVFAFGEVHRQVFVRQALERERDAHTEGRRGAEVVVELHGDQG
ncbi:hypothetical protein FQZ97_1005730 [compost metagenome]